MRTITFLVYTTLFLTSCNKLSSGECKENIICYTDKPDSLYVKLELSTKPNPDTTRVALYIGNMDDGKLHDSFLTAKKEIYYIMPVDKRYTATAEYIVGQDTVLVIDSGKLKLKSCESGDYTCYDWDAELVLDLNLKD